MCLYTKNFVPPSEPFTYDAEAANKDVTGWFPASPGVIGLITGINNLIPSASGQLTIPEASKTFPGLMSATDKGKLDSFNITESKTSPGYFKLPGGTIVQWGNFVVSADPQTQEITLPVALSSAYVRQASGSNSSLKIGIYGGTDGKITCYVEGNTSGTVNWMVIGK